MNTSRNLTKLGTLYCALSAVTYTAYNVCLNDVSQLYDSAWINCVQAAVSAAAIGVYLLWQAAHGQPALPPPKESVALLGIGLITQLGGVLFVWAMSVVGVAITATLQTGGLLAMSAILGLIVLGERVSWLQVIAIILITVSVVCLSMGAGSTGETTSGPLPPAKILLGIAAGALAGLAFAVLTVGVRKTVTGNTSPLAIVFLINLMGVVALGPWSVYQLGIQTLAHTAPRDFAVMLAAGVLNLMAFLLVTKSLQMISVVRFNVLNNGLTTALSAAVGIVLLAEPCNTIVLFGLLLSIGGIVLISLVVPPSEQAVEVNCRVVPPPPARGGGPGRGRRALRPRPQLL
jgi:drug/metabolite transporter (DMT)-like permease